MRWPLGVSVQDGAGIRSVTRLVSDLSFSQVAPGGYGVCSFLLRVRPGELSGFGPNSRVILTDARSGRVAWEGYAEYPEPVHGDGYDGYAVSAVGPMVLLTDESKPRLFVDGPEGLFDESKWRRTKLTAPGTTVEFATPTSSDDETTGSYVTLQFPSGQAVDNSSRSGTEYDLPARAGVAVCGIHYGAVWGVASANYGWRVTGRKADGSGRQTLVGGDFSGIGISDLSVPFDSTPVTDVRLQIHRLSGGVTTVAGDNVTVSYFDMGLLAQLKKLDGTFRTASSVVPLSGSWTVSASWVVEDLVSRMPAGLIDLAVSSIDGTAPQDITQLAYPESVTAATVLDDLSLLAPGYTWELGAKNTNGHPFTYRAWTDRYEIPRSAGVWDAAGPEADLCNRVEVSWETRSGRPRSVAVTATVPELGSRVRDAEPIELPSGLGSVTNAQIIGAQVLAELSSPKPAGTFTATGRIYDRVWCRWVEPWEIQAGWYATLRETGERMQVREVTCSDSQGTATLTLGQPSLTLEQRVARLDTPRRSGRGRRRRGNRR